MSRIKHAAPYVLTACGLVLGCFLLIHFLGLPSPEARELEWRELWTSGYAAWELDLLRKDDWWRLGIGGRHLAFMGVLLVALGLTWLAIRRASTAQ